MLVLEIQNCLSNLKNRQPGDGANEDFLCLCAKVYESLAGSTDSENLRQNANVFETITGPGSALDNVRRELCTLTGVDSSFPNEVTISMGENCYVLKTEGLEPLQFTIEETTLFTKFLHRVAVGAAGELPLR